VTAHHRSRTARCAVAIAVLAGIATGGCTSDDEAPGPVAATENAEARVLTTEEAQRLAAMRFTNYDLGVREIHLEVADRGVTYAVSGWVDFAALAGYATIVDTASSTADATLVAWTDTTVSTHPATPADPGSPGRATPPLPPPDPASPAWTDSALSPTESRLHTVLALILQAGHDRPDNALLLQQTDARYLRSDEVDGIAVDVIAGPTSDHAYDPATATTAPNGRDATIRYWIGGDSVLHRLEVRLGGGTDWTAVHLGEAVDVAFADALVPAA
jgi:hypothetical protein